MSDNTAGLRGVVAGQTAISHVEEAGDGLFYRGHSITDLIEYPNYEEVAYLLLHSHLPNMKSLQQMQHRLATHVGLPTPVQTILEMLPVTTHPMDVLRTVVSFLGSIEPEDLQMTPWTIAERLMVLLPSTLNYWHHFHKHGKRMSVQHRSGALTSIPEYFLVGLLQREIAPEAAKALAVSWVLYAEHEFNASTFAARVTAATLSDFYSCLCSAISTLKGHLHGGANEAVMHLLLTCRNPEEAEKKVVGLLAQKRLIMGFGHRVYKKQDPRSTLIKPWAKKLCQQADLMSLFEIAERVEQVMAREKNMFPNVDFYSAVLYFAMGIPIPFYTPLFVFARLSGWSAHIIEQRQNNRLIRPAAEYVGPPPQKYVPIQQRD